jgi:drug/metabolite transporter (DMT)-like permease
MAAMRALLAGLILLAASGALRHRLRLTSRELIVLFISGQLLWLGGNGLVVWAEQHADSGYAAVVVGSTPIWVATINALIDRRRPSWLLVVSLALGLLGVGVLSGLLGLPAGRGRVSGPVDLAALAALLGASVTWSFGTVLQRRRPVGVSAQVSSAYQLLFGGLGFVVVRTLTAEPVPQPVPEAWLAWLYLVVFGSLIAFTAFIAMLRLLPPNIAMTYSYVNPAVAVFLGWLVLGEPLTLWTWLGVGLVLVGVGGVYRTRH